MCDSKFFKVTNTKTGEVKCYKRAASIARRFKVHKRWISECLGDKNLSLGLNGDRYRVNINNHPECQRLRWKIKKYFGIHPPSYMTEQQINHFKERIVHIEYGS